MITFTAGPGTKLMLYVEIADPLIVAMGWPPHVPGEVSVEQLAATLARLRLAFEDSITHAPLVNGLQTASRALPAAPDRRADISLAERAAPLIELFERAQRTRNPVSWR